MLPRAFSIWAPSWLGAGGCSSCRGRAGPGRPHLPVQVSCLIMVFLVRSSAWGDPPPVLCLPAGGVMRCWHPSWLPYPSAWSTCQLCACAPCSQCRSAALCHPSQCRFRLGTSVTQSPIRPAEPGGADSIIHPPSAHIDLKGMIDNYLRNLY